MPIPNVTAGAVITEAWGDQVADAINAHAHSGSGDGGTQVAHSALSGIAATDHHAAPAAGPDANVTVDAAGAAGTASTFARSGHGHQVVTYASTPAAATAAGSAGTSTTAPARGDHAHPSGTSPGQVHTINYVIDGGGAVIATGVKGDLVIDFACTITKWTLLGDQSGSIVVDIWRDSYANFPPVVGDVITASAKPTISASTKGQSSSLTGWSTAIAAGDVLRFNVNSATTITRATLALTVTRT